MENRGYKLQEFEAHSATVNCISIGNKTCRRFITGGDDNLVNLWAIGNSTSLMSLHGHTSPVESVAFDSGEVMVVAGASTGAIKLWDLEEVKMVRNLTGHRSYCTAVEFHPFGDFFASGSMDTNLKVWDIRKKGCIHTYKGHTRGINTVKFTPDGRWMVTGGLDNVVKVWDLTAGKLLRDLKFHEGHIRSINFHPLEFLLATGSADKTVKFWDLETFELIGSTRHEATGIRATTFHPDGRALFCGLDDNLKVYSWEPVICHDGVDMKWSTLSDLCIHEGKLLGCSHFRNSVGVWIADISLIEPYVADPELKSRFSKQKIDDNGSRSPKKVGHGLKSILDSRSAYPDYESNEIKTIYVDSAGQNNTPPCADMVSALDSKKSTGMVVQKHGLPVKTHQKDDKETSTRSIVMPTVVLRDNPDDKDLSCLQRASAISRMFDSDNMLKPADNQNPSMNTYDSSAKSKTTKKVAVGIDGVVDSHGRLEAKVDSRGFCEEENLSIKNVAGKSGNILSLQTKRDHKQCSDTQNSSKEMNSVKFVNGDAVVCGRTRSLVERFEKREMANSNEDQPSSTCLSENNVPEKVSTMISGTDDAVTMTHESETDKVPSIIPSIDIVPDVVSVADKATPMVFLTDKAPPTVPEIIKEPLTVPETEKVPLTVPETEKLPITVPETVKASTMVSKVNRATAVVPKAVKKSPKVPETLNSTTRLHAPKERFPVTSAAGKRSPVTSAAGKRSPVTSAAHRRSPTIPVRHRRSSIAPVTDRTIPIVPATEKISCVTRETDKTFTLQSELPQISGEESTSGKDGRLTEDLLQTHDVILSTFRSRLTKLQVIRHFWERNDIKGAINAMKKLPDHSVQADVLSTLMEKMEILTLDLFSFLLPVLVGLLDSSLERHVKISLEMLLKLVAVFGQVIRSSISAPPPVGVDIHAEERLEHCNQCFMHLQKIQSMIPTLLRRGGLIAKSAQELNLVLQQS